MGVVCWAGEGDTKECRTSSQDRRAKTTTRCVTIAIIGQLIYLLETGIERLTNGSVVCQRVRILLQVQRLGTTTKFLKRVQISWSTRISEDLVVNITTSKSRKSYS